MGQSATGFGGLVPKPRWEAIEWTVAFVTCLLIGSRLLVYQQVCVGYLVAFALLPITLREVLRCPAAVTYLWVSGLCLVSGLLLTAFRGARGVDRVQILIVTVELLGVAATLAALYWALPRLGTGLALLAYAAGMLIFVNHGSDLYSTNPWRFGYELPVSLLILSVAAISRNTRLEFVALVLLVGLLALTRAGRSSLAAKLVALVLLAFWLLRGKRRSLRFNVASTVVFITALAWAAQAVLESLLLEGLLGEEVQAKSQAQTLAGGGNVLLGGRPEAGATIALMAYRWMGFGVGVLPSWNDVEKARSGMAAVGYDASSGYIDHYMFGDGFRLHSMLGDLWSAFGPVGIILALLIGWHAVKSISLGPGERGGAALTLVCASHTLWNLAFSPWYSSISVLTLLLPVTWLRIEEAASRELATPRPGSTPTWGPG